MASADFVKTDPMMVSRVARFIYRMPAWRRGMATSTAIEDAKSQAKAALISAHAVCFDVDSTVCQNEG